MAQVKGYKMSFSMIFLSLSGILVGDNFGKCNITRDIDHFKEESFSVENQIMLKNWTEEEHYEFFKAVKIRDKQCIFRRTGRLIMLGSFFALCVVVYIGWFFWRERRVQKARFKVKKSLFQKANQEWV